MKAKVPVQIESGAFKGSIDLEFDEKHIDDAKKLLVNQINQRLEEIAARYAIKAEKMLERRFNASFTKAISKQAEVLAASKFEEMLPELFPAIQAKTRAITDETVKQIMENRDDLWRREIESAVHTVLGSRLNEVATTVMDQVAQESVNGSVAAQTVAAIRERIEAKLAAAVWGPIDRVIQEVVNSEVNNANFISVQKQVSAWVRGIIDFSAQKMVGLNER